MTIRKTGNDLERHGCHDAYTDRQREMDAAYVAEYRKFVAGLSPLERRKLEEQGIDRADTSRATHSPDSAGLLERMEASPQSMADEEEKNKGGGTTGEEVARVLRMALSNVFHPGPGRTREYELDVLGIAIGVIGLGSVQAVANRHGVGRQAISKAAVKFCREGGLPPSIYMKSEANREKHRSANKRGRRRA